MLQSVILGDSQQGVMAQKQNVTERQKPPVSVSFEITGPAQASKPNTDSWLPASLTVRTVAANLANQVVDTVSIALPVVSASASKIQDVGVWVWQAMKDPKDSYVSKPIEQFRPLQPEVEPKSLPDLPMQKNLIADEPWEYLEDIPSMHPGSPPIIGDDV